MELEHFADAQTRQGKLRKPIQRHDSAPPHPNPVRRFREELKLTRDEFAALVGVPKTTQRSWELDIDSVVPGHHRLMRLIECARMNQYPLYVWEIMAYAEKTKT